MFLFIKWLDILNKIVCIIYYVSLNNPLSECLIHISHTQAHPIARVCFKATNTIMASTVDHCICAICKDDISTTLGRRRILFHFSEGRENINHVVREFGAIFEVFSGRKCQISSDTIDPNSIDNVYTKWCCRKCERQVSCIYKKVEEVCQFYTQFRECPLANFLTDFCLKDDKANDHLQRKLIFLFIKWY